MFIFCHFPLKWYHSLSPSSDHNSISFEIEKQKKRNMYLLMKHSSCALTEGKVKLEICFFNKVSRQIQNVNDLKIKQVILKIYISSVMSIPRPHTPLLTDLETRVCFVIRVNVYFHHYMCPRHHLLSFCMSKAWFVSQVSVVNQLDMQVVVSNVSPTVVEQNKDRLIG